MGRSRAWASRVEWTVAGQYWTHSEWVGKLYGRATDANLSRHVAAMVACYLPGGIMANQGRELGVPRVLAARVVSQRTGKVLATYAA